MAEPRTRRDIPRPRLGYFGVIDERIDTRTGRRCRRRAAGLAAIWSGPVVKIDPDDLPRAPNIHYLGRKAYAELPAYLAGWDVAFMPFAINDATRFISPTKTPEYLAAGSRWSRPRSPMWCATMGDLEAVRIAATPAEFVAALEAALR